MSGSKKLGDYGLPIALCRFYLRDGTWIALGINTNPTAKHRSSPNDDVILFEVSVVIDGPNIVGMSEPRFRRRKVLEDGTLEPIDLRRAVDVMDAYERDRSARASGAVGINREVVRRRRYPQDWEPSEALYQSAMDRVADLVKRRAAGGKPTGMTVVEPD